MLNEHRRNLRRRICRYDEIEIAHNFLSAAITARDANVEGVRLRPKIVLQLLRFARDFAELELARVFLPLVNRAR